jgi:hypothetical protein
MKGSYIEGLANHGGPSHALVSREGAAKRWSGVHAGRLLSLESHIWGADAVTSDGRQYRWRRFRESSVDPAGSKNPCMRAISPCSRTGRAHSHPCLSVMPRPIWVAGWRVGGRRVVRGRPRP